MNGDDAAAFVGAHGLDPSQYGVAPTQTTSAPAPSSSSDISGGYHITKPPPPLPGESDASLLARAGIAEGGPSAEGQTAVIRALLQRQAESGKSIATLLSEPGQIEGYWRGTIQGVDPTSPAYQSALKIAQTATPSPGIDSWGNPAVIKQRGWGTMPFDPSTGTMIGGQLFGNGHYGGGKGSDEADAFISAHGKNPADYKAAPAAPGAAPASDPALDAAAAGIARNVLESNAASGHAQWPIYDPANRVGRNADGSIAWIGPPPEAPTYGPDGSTQIHLGQSSNPDAIRAWMAAHPLDPSNAPSTYGAGATKSGWSQAGTGALQGLANVKNSLEGADAFVRGLPGGNLLLSGVGDYGPLGGGNRFLNVETADLARGVLNRNANDVRFGGGTPYELGVLGGELAPSVPLIAATEGLGGAIGGAGMEGTGAADLLNYVGSTIPGRGVILAGRGALQGGEGAALTSAGSSAPLDEQIKKGATAGAVLSPLLGGVAGTARFVKNVASPFLAPLTEGGREGILADNLAASTGKASLPADLTEYVPGSRPTLAQATQNPALAVTERTLKSTNNAAAQAFADLADSNAAARDAHLEGITGDADGLAAMKAARETATSDLRNAAFANKTTTDPTPVLQTIDSILASPAGQRDAVRVALLNVRGKIATDVDLGNGKTVAQLQTDPEQLYGIRQAIGDLLSPLAARSGSNAQLAASELKQVQGALDPVIEKGAPGFDKYMDAYRAASGPINAAEYLQGLGLRDMRGNLTLGQVNRAITKIETDRAAPGVNGAKDITDDQLQGLYNLRADLRRADLTVPLGRAGRSSIVTGNLDNQGVLDAVTNPLLLGVAGAVSGHPAGALAIGVGKAALAQKKSVITNMLIDRMLNPNPLVAPLKNVTPKLNPPLVPPNLLSIAPPAAAGIGAGQSAP